MNHKQQKKHLRKHSHENNKNNTETSEPLLYNCKNHFSLIPLGCKIVRLNLNNLNNLNSSRDSN